MGIKKVVSTIGHDAKVVGEDVGKTVAYPFTNAIHFARILETGLEDEGELKNDIVELVKLADIVIADGSLNITEHGLNIPDDIATAKSIETFFSYFGGTFISEVEKVYSDLKKDVDAKYIK